MSFCSDTSSMAFVPFGPTLQPLATNAMKEGTLVDYYYSKRAREYERIYHKRERQEDLTRLREYLCLAVKGHRVLELACGTGYWTEAIAEAAETVLATDASDEVLEVARSKCLDPVRVSFALADAYGIRVPGDFTAGFAGFWWSHIPRAKLPAFLVRFHSALLPGARVIFADNRFVTGSSTPICRRDEAGNTYQLRRLDDGTSHEVLKNFPSAQELIDVLQPYSVAVELAFFEYFWCARYALKTATSASRPES